MNMIEKLGGHGLASAVGAVHKKKSEAAQDAFSAILRQMETGGGAPRGEQDEGNDCREGFNGHQHEDRAHWGRERS